MRKLIYAAIAAFAMMMPAQTWALCICQCSNGFLQPLCSNPFDIPPICPATGCAMVPIASPYQAPVRNAQPVICRQVRACDPYGMCRLQQVCD